MSTTISTLLAIARGDSQVSSRTTVAALIAASLEGTARAARHIEIRGDDDVPSVHASTPPSTLVSVRWHRWWRTPFSTPSATSTSR